MFVFDFGRIFTAHDLLNAIAEHKITSFCAPPTAYKMMIHADMSKYDIPVGASAWKTADMFANGRVASTTIVIPEGLTVKQIKDLLLQSSTLTGAVECRAGISFQKTMKRI